MIMKKFISVTIVLLLIVSCVCMPASALTQANVGELKLPFELKPAKTVALSKVSDDGQTDVQFSYSMDSDMIKFMQDCEKPGYKENLMKELGIDDLWINAQIDWAIDDPNDWHHTEFWDDNAGTRYFGLGSDSEGRSRLCEWDVVDLLLYPQTTNDCWITRYAGNPAEPGDTRWYGEDYEGGVHRPGMKDVLKQDQYRIVKEDEENSHIEIDYKAHTLYARMRYYVVVRFSEADENGAIDRFLFSDWSDSAAYGKDAAQWQPYTAENLEAPDISDLFVTDEIFNEYPVVGYSLHISDELAKGITEITARGGGITISTEARVKGSSQWKELQGDFIVKDGILKSDILALNGDGKPLNKGSEIEFRARYFCSEKLEYSGETIAEFYSPYSRILTVNLDKDYNPTKPAPPKEQKIPDVKPSSDMSPGSNAASVNKFITEKVKNDSDPKGTTFGILSAKQKKVSKNSITLTWNKVKGASYYMVYGNKCGYTGKVFNQYVLLANTKKTNASFKKILKKNIEKATYYKFMVVAVGGNNKVVASSKTAHIATLGGKYTNPKKVTVNKKIKKNKIKLKKGKSIALKAKSVKANKKLKVLNHRTMKYESSDKKIATVSNSGKISAKKKGKCFVYAYALNGIYSKIAVTVK